ncbi:MAG: DUF6580 family putative transport protein [Bacteroidota bacterium]
MRLPESKRFFMLSAMVLLAAASRLLPHPPNFTPLAAMALFGATYFRKSWLAWLVPFAALYLSDLVLNNVVYAEAGTGFSFGVYWVVYLAFGLIVLLGFAALRRKKLNVIRLLGVGIGATLLFFLVTNFWSWYTDPFDMYPNDISGLLLSYEMGLPFLRNSFLGNLVFGAVLFGGAYYFSLTPAVMPVKHHANVIDDAF